MNTYRVEYQTGKVEYIEAKSMRDAIAYATSSKGERAVDIQQVEDELA